MTIIKFLTDENIATLVVKTLRKGGFDVKDVKEEKCFGATDHEILSIANTENRILITHDKDFAYLASVHKQHKGIILLRFKNQNPQHVADILLRTVQSDIAPKLPKRFTMISESTIMIH